MEETNKLAADCIVISCCCQCLILQIVIFVLLKLPYKIIRKTREYAGKKLRQRTRGVKMTARALGEYRDDFIGLQQQSFSVQADRLSMDGGHGCGSCMEEVEKVLEELSQRGEFAFGSFWGRKNISGSLSNCVAKEELDNVVQYQIIEVIGSFSCSK